MVNLYLIGFVCTFGFLLYEEIEDRANTYPVGQEVFWNSLFLSLIFPVTWFVLTLWKVMESLNGKD